MAAVELTFFFIIIILFSPFLGHKLDYVTVFGTGRIKCPSLHTSSMNPPPPLQRSPVLIGPGEMTVPGI